MVKTFSIAAIILILLGGVTFAWWRARKPTGLPKIPAPSFQQEATVSPTPQLSLSSVKGMKQAPTTGVNLLFPLLGSAGIGLAGWYLLKKK